MSAWNHFGDARTWSARLRPLLTVYNPPYAACERKTERTIPVVVLRRA